MTRSQVPRVASTPRRATQSTDTLRSVRIALDVLECFATDEELGVTDIATKIGVAKSTAHRMLSVLVERGYAEQVEGSTKYRLGIHIYELGQLAQERHHLRWSALPLMRTVQEATGLIVNLSVPDGADVVFVERLEQPDLAHLVEHLGRRLPAHTTSSGKVIAAYNPSFDAARRLTGFPPRVSRTVRSAADWDRARLRPQARVRPLVERVGRRVVDRRGADPQPLRHGDCRHVRHGDHRPGLERGPAPGADPPLAGGSAAAPAVTRAPAANCRR